MRAWGKWKPLRSTVPSMRIFLGRRNKAYNADKEVGI